MHQMRFSSWKCVKTSFRPEIPWGGRITLPTPTSQHSLSWTFLAPQLRVPPPLLEIERLFLWCCKSWGHISVWIIADGWFAVLHGYHGHFCHLVRHHVTSYSLPKLGSEQFTARWHTEICMVEYIWRVQHWRSVWLVMKLSRHRGIHTAKKCLVSFLFNSSQVDNYLNI